MKKNTNRLAKILALTVLALGIIFGVVFGILYLKETTPSERELWRIRDNNLEEAMLVNSSLLFEGYKGEFPHSRCEYIYAVDKDTGKPIWSFENFTTQYCNQSAGPVYTAIILLAKDQDVIYVSSSYWITDEEQEYVLYAINNSTGELLWKIDEYAGYPYSLDALLNYSATDTNYIYIVSNQGSFSAIDNRTGKQVWRQEIPKVKFDNSENIFIEYSDQMVYYYYSGNHTLLAFDTRDGSQIWEKSNLDSVDYVFFSENLMYLKSSSYTDVHTAGGGVGAPYYVTALDKTTGKQVWEVSFEDVWLSAEIISNKVYILIYRHEGSFEDFKTFHSLMAVNKDTGELIWQFNEDYSHGDLNYLVQDNVVYIGTKDNYLFALDGETGKTIWQVKDSGLPYYFHIKDNTLIVVYEEKYASGFDTKTGKQKWLLDVGMDTSWYPWNFILTGDGVIYISSTINRMVYAIDIGTGKILWTWNHYRPQNDAYMLKALDNDVLYVDQASRFLGYNWFFALRVKP